MVPAAPIVVSTIGMPSLFPMRHDDLESHRADRLYSPHAAPWLKARSTAFSSLVWCEPTIVRTCFVMGIPHGVIRKWSKAAKWGNVPVKCATFRANSYAENVREYAGTWN